MLRIPSGFRVIIRLKLLLHGGLSLANSNHVDQVSHCFVLGGLVVTNHGVVPGVETASTGIEKIGHELEG